MSAKINQDFVTYKGDDVAPIFLVQDADGVAIDISTVSDIRWNARRNDDTIVLSKTKAAGGITFVTDGTNGEFQVLLGKADTQALDGFYVHEAQIVDASSNVTTVSVGRMQVGLQPLWTYDPGALMTSTLYQVRRLIGDTKQNDPQINDEEVNFCLSLYPNVYLAAAEAARQIAANYARQVDIVQAGTGGNLTTNYSQRSKAFSLLAATLEQRGMSRGAFMPYAGGISQADKQTQEDNADRVQPQFVIGMMDNLLPVGVGSGHETPGNPDG